MVQEIYVKNCGFIMIVVEYKKRILLSEIDIINIFKNKKIDLFLKNQNKYYTEDGYMITLDLLISAVCSAENKKAIEILIKIIEQIESLVINIWDNK